MSERSAMSEREKNVLARSSALLCAVRAVVLSEALSIDVNSVYRVSQFVTHLVSFQTLLMSSDVETTFS